MNEETIYTMYLFSCLIFFFLRVRSLLGQVEATELVPCKGDSAPSETLQCDPISQ
jgi:hypothetical protein